MDCNERKKNDIEKEKRTAAAAALTAFRRVSFFRTFVPFGMALLSTLRNPYARTLAHQTPKSNDRAFNKIKSGEGKIRHTVVVTEAAAAA